MNPAREELLASTAVAGAAALAGYDLFLLGQLRLDASSGSGLDLVVVAAAVVAGLLIWRNTRKPLSADTVGTSLLLVILSIVIGGGLLFVVLLVGFYLLGPFPSLLVMNVVALGVLLTAAVLARNRLAGRRVVELAVLAVLMAASTALALTGVVRGSLKFFDSFTDFSVRVQWSFLLVQYWYLGLAAGAVAELVGRRRKTADA